MDIFLAYYVGLSLATMAVLALVALWLWLTGREEQAGGAVAAVVVVGLLPLIALWALLRLLIPRGHDE